MTEDGTTTEDSHVDFLNLIVDIFIDIIYIIQKMFQLPSIRYIDYDACLIIERCN